MEFFKKYDLSSLWYITKSLQFYKGNRFHDFMLACNAVFLLNYNNAII